MQPEGLSTLRAGAWGLGRARALAAELGHSPRGATKLVRLLLGGDSELRKRVADVLRRATEDPQWRTASRGPEPHVLQRYADELVGRLATLDAAEARTRWHLGLVVARVVHTRAQRLRAAPLLERLTQDPSIVSRCSGIEGLALLASREPQLRVLAEEICLRARSTGTAAERCRAREGLRRLEGASQPRRRGR